ncbi:MAG TPA: hypothetical protein VHC69_31980 [Polyangiaceae bacterium]|nr:hypothetical protein [Polyangiaceae bacterium]
MISQEHGRIGKDPRSCPEAGTGATLPSVRLAIAEALVACGACAALAGCQASVEANVNTPKSEAEVADFDKPLDQSAIERAQASKQPAPDTALLGARQDLSFNGATTPRCKCLAVYIGTPGDSAFQWAGTRPTIDQDTEVVLALTSSGVSCDAGANLAPASYWGYEIVGQDVVVGVEAAKPGRPVAQGAIIPRPAAGGHIYVRPVTSDIPYGRPASGQGDRCVVASLARPEAASAAPAPSASSPPGWKSIKSEESDPSSTKVDIP